MANEKVFPDKSVLEKEADDNGYLSQAGYARYRGVSRQYVKKLIDLGKIRLTDCRKINPAEADLELDKGADPARSMDTSHDLLSGVDHDGDEDAPEATAEPEEKQDKSYATSSAKLKHFQAERARLEFLRQAGELVSAEDVQNAISDLLQDLRQEVMTFPAANAGKLAACQEERKIIHTAEEALNAIFEKFADSLTERLSMHDGNNQPG